jgi:predicted transglutaminase-like cysteine proteinase
MNYPACDTIRIVFCSAVFAWVMLSARAAEAIDLALHVIPPAHIDAPIGNTGSPITQPDVFNSIALEISASPLDDQWQHVSDSVINKHSRSFATSLRGMTERGRIEAVNKYVNTHVAFTPDYRQYKVADHWALASVTLVRGRGDCEDFAIAKMALLRRAGFTDQNLYLVIVKDVFRIEHHAVLVVRSDRRFWVLDNVTDRVLESILIKNYRPVLTFTSGRRFTHGYRRHAQGSLRSPR